MNRFKKLILASSGILTIGLGVPLAAGTPAGATGSDGYHSGYHREYQHVYHAEHGQYDKQHARHQKHYPYTYKDWSYTRSVDYDDKEDCEHDSDKSWQSWHDDDSKSHEYWASRY